MSLLKLHIVTAIVNYGKSSVELPRAPFFLIHILGESLVEKCECWGGGGWGKGYSIKLNKVPLAKKEEESYRNDHALISVLGEGNYYLKSKGDIIANFTAR